MPTKVTRSAKPGPKPKVIHRPTFPVREPAKVELINQGAIRPHPTRHGWLMWGIMGLCMLMGVFFSQQILAAYNWVRIETNERVYTELGKEVCKRPLMTIPERDCENCFSSEQEILIQRYEAQARGHNLWQAENCIPLI